MTMILLKERCCPLPERQNPEQYDEYNMMNTGG